MKKWLLFGVCLLLPAPASASLDGLTFITEEYPPYNFQRGERLEGISIEILERIFEETETPLSRDDVLYYPWARGYDTALADPGTVLFSTTRTEQRESLFQWVGPIATDRVTLIARRDSGIQLDSLDELANGNYRVAVIREDIGAQRLEEAGVPSDQLRLAMSNVSALKMLDRGRVDLWAYSEDVAFWLMQEHDLPIADFMSVLTISESDLYYALHRDTDPALVERMQAAVDALRHRGELGDIYSAEMIFNTEEYPPYNYLTDDGDIDGESTRLLRAALEEAGLSARFRLLPWARAYTEAQMRDNHCVYSTALTPEREPHFTWIGPIAANEWAAYSLADADVEAGSLDELASLRVGSFRGDAAGELVEQQGIPIVTASADHENIARLTAGLIDAWVSNVETATYLASEAEVELRQLFIFHAAQLYLACHPSVPVTFATRLQTAIERLRTAESGTLEPNGEAEAAR
ncbi:substrate-binding periplasmic protein [Billgrantia montanilacus]|uniref:Solute-binding protein family 3/N-terminal domain-containing protein n=1 Tax=Billgrantia montanilacus TaxID=2282305 RepID=A0A368TU47_9GAMM|nr:transporter substrate-binding domain-containing protein [Halomonas montanilacus]RCV88224.1 hypothetical protein DU505_14840 [Halomonas montanilacus]